MFDKYDPNRDSYLEKNEIKAMLSDLMKKRNKEVTKDDLDKYTETFMIKADTDRNGKIDRDEFYAYYKAQ